MNFSRLVILLMIPVASFSVRAQRRRGATDAARSQFYEHGTSWRILKDVSRRYSSKTVTGLESFAVRMGPRVKATEIHDSVNGATARSHGAIVVTAGHREIRSVIDYDEIDALVKAMDTAAKATESITRLSTLKCATGPKATLKSWRSAIENNVIAAAIEGGFFDRSRLYLSIEDLVKLRWMIVRATSVWIRNK
jgi:hypothetical protein